MATLEFVEDPKKAIEEVSRVTKDRIFIGVLNRYAIKGIQIRIKEFSSNHLQPCPIFQYFGTQKNNSYNF